MKFETGEMYVFRIEKDKEIVEEIKKFAKKNDIGCGMINVIGALKSSTLGYFNPKKKKYEKIDIEEQSELVSCMGNISIKDNDIFIHLHALLANRDFSIIGGHLIKGDVYVAEVFVLPCKGKIERKPAMDNLYLWDLKK